MMAFSPALLSTQRVFYELLFARPSLSTTCLYILC